MNMRRNPTVMVDDGVGDPCRFRALTTIALFEIHTWIMCRVISETNGDSA